jgi:hypothetical protein
MANTQLPLETPANRLAIGCFACMFGISTAAWSQQPAPTNATQNNAAPKADAAPPALPAEVELPQTVPPVMTFTKELIRDRRTRPGKIV